MDGVIGVQVCNEAEWDAKGMLKFEVELCFEEFVMHGLISR